MSSPAARTRRRIERSLAVGSASGFRLTTRSAIAAVCLATFLAATARAVEVLAVVEATYILEKALRQLARVIAVGYLVPLSARALLTLGIGRSRMRRLALLLWLPRYHVELWLVATTLAVSLAALFEFEQIVPAFNERLFDSELWRADELVHFGVAPAAVFSEGLARLALLPWIDRLYPRDPVWLAPIALLFLFGRRLRRRGPVVWLAVVFTVAGLVVGAFLVPALGPAHYRANRLAWLDDAPVTLMQQRAEIEQYVAFRSTPGERKIRDERGIVAFCNGGVAVLAAFATAAHGVPGLAIALWLATIVAGCSGLALGFGYAVSAYSSASLGCVSVLLARWIVSQSVGAGSRAVAAPQMTRQSSAPLGVA